MKKALFTILTVTFLGITGFASAQDEGNAARQAEDTKITLMPEDSKFSIDLSLMLRNRHIWVGGLSYGAWNLQPDLCFSYYGFYFDIWAVYTVASPFGMEIDLTLGWGNDYIDINYADVYYANEDRKFNHFFRYDRQDGGNIHQHVAQLTYKGVPQFPLGVGLGMFTYGDYEQDFVLDSEGRHLDAKGNVTDDPDEYDFTWGKSQWSMWIELMYEHTIRTGQTLGYSIIGTPYKGFFADGPNLIQLKFSVSQPLKITSNFSLNLQADVILNPYREDLFFVFGVGF